MFKTIGLVIFLTISSLTAFPVLASGDRNLICLEHTNNDNQIMAQTAKRITFSAKNLKQGINPIPINSRQWVEISVKGDYITQVIVKNQDGRFSQLNIKPSSVNAGNVSEDKSFYFRSDGCSCWEDEDAQQSVCTQACFN